MIFEYGLFFGLFNPAPPCAFEFSSKIYHKNHVDMITGVPVPKLRNNDSIVIFSNLRKNLFPNVGQTIEWETMNKEQLDSLIKFLDLKM